MFSDILNILNIWWSLDEIRLSFFYLQNSAYSKNNQFSSGQACNLMSCFSHKKVSKMERTLLTRE